MDALEEQPPCPRCNAALQRRSEAFSCSGCRTEQRCEEWASEWRGRLSALDRDDSPEGLRKRAEGGAALVALLGAMQGADGPHWADALACAHHNRANALQAMGEAGSLALAVNAYDVAIRLLEAVQQADRPGLSHRLACAHTNRAMALVEMGDRISLERALEDYAVSIRLLGAIQRDGQPNWAGDLASAHGGRGDALRRAGDRTSLMRAVEACDTAIGLLRAMQRNDQPDLARGLANVYVCRGNALVMLDGVVALAGAVQSYERAMELYESPSNGLPPDWTHALAGAYQGRGNALARMGDLVSLAAAIRDYDRAIHLIESRQRDDRPEGVRALALMYLGRADALAMTSDVASLVQAVQDAGVAIRLLGDIPSKDHWDWATDLARAHNLRGNTRLRWGAQASRADAVMDYGRAIQLLEPLPRDKRPDLACLLASVHSNRGLARMTKASRAGAVPNVSRDIQRASLVEAAEDFDRAIQLLQPLSPDDHQKHADELSRALSLRGTAATALTADVDPVEAINYFSRALSLLDQWIQGRRLSEDAVPHRLHAGRAMVLRQRAQLHWRLGRHEPAVADWSKAWEGDLAPLLKGRHMEGERLAEDTVRLLLRGLASMKEWRHSLDVSEAALERLPHRPVVYDVLVGHLHRVVAARVEPSLKSRATQLAHRVEETYRLLFGDNAWAALRHARGLAARGQAEPARSHLSAWSAKHPEDWTGPAAEMSLAVQLQQFAVARALQQRALHQLREELRHAEPAFVPERRPVLLALLEDFLRTGVCLELANLRAATGPAALAANAEVRLRSSQWIGRVRELAEQTGFDAELRPILAEQETLLIGHERAEAEVQQQALRMDLEASYRERTAKLRDSHQEQAFQVHVYGALLGRTLGRRKKVLDAGIQALRAEVGPMPTAQEFGAQGVEAWAKRVAGRVAELVCEFANADAEERRRAALDRAQALLGDRFLALTALQQRLLGCVAEALHGDTSLPPFLTLLGLLQAVETVFADRLLTPVRRGLTAPEQAALLAPLVGLTPEEWSKLPENEARKRLAAAEREGRWKPEDRFAALLGNPAADIYLAPLLFAIGALLRRLHMQDRPSLNLVARHLQAHAKEPALLLDAAPETVGRLCTGHPMPLDRLNELRNRCAHIIDDLDREGEGGPGEADLRWAAGLTLAPPAGLLALVLDALLGRAAVVPGTADVPEASADGEQGRPQPGTAG